MSVAVVVPYRAGCPHRERAWAWVRQQYAQHHPTWQVLEAPGPPGPWVKASALMPVALAVDAQVIVLADADVWSDGLQAAVTRVSNGRPWAIPHRMVHRLGEQATSDRIVGRRPDPKDLAQRPYMGVIGGGIVVLTPDALRVVPMDSRFTGFGGEDEAFGYALATMLGGPWRGSAPLEHLWHPPQERMTRRVGSAANEKLRRRYAQARKRPAVMTRLLAEVNTHDHRAAHEPAMCDYAPRARGR